MRRLPFVPSSRAVTIAAITAPIALLVAAFAPALWFALPLALLVMLVLLFFDAMLAGPLADVRVTFPHLAEVGEETVLGVAADFARGPRVRAAQLVISFDPRLADGGRADATLVHQDGRHWSADIAVTPNRRGEAALENIWLRWSGPLGLGHRQELRSVSAAIAVRPSLSPVRSPQLQAFFRDAQFGMVARRIRGAGTQFEAMTEYEAGMDRRRIDWKSSARHMHLQAREYESERDNQIVFAIDCGQAMCEPVDGIARLDRAVTAALTASYIGLKGGDRIAMFGFAGKPLVSSPFFNDVRSFHSLQRNAASLDYHGEEPNFTLALATLGARLKRRSLIVIFSDFTDLTSAELMVESVGRLVKHHLVLFVTMQDSELDAISDRDPESLEDLAMAVTADTLSTQRALVLQRLRHLGVDVLEAPWDRIGFQLIDRYLDIKRKGAIG